MTNIRQQLASDRAKIHRLYAARARQLNNDFEQATTRSDYARIRATAQQIVSRSTFLDINGALLALVGRADEVLEQTED